MPKQEMDIACYNRLSPQRKEALRPSIDSGQLMLVVRGYERCGAQIVSAQPDPHDYIRSIRRDLYGGLVLSNYKSNT